MDKVGKIICGKEFAQNVDKALEEKDDLKINKYKSAGVSFVKNKKNNNIDRAIVSYCVSNIFDYFCNMHIRYKDQKNGYEHLKENVVYFLRLALVLNQSCEGVGEDTLFRVKTNLSKSLLDVGRFVEAADVLNETCESGVKFGMAHSFLGGVLYEYACYVENQDYQFFLLKKSKESLVEGFKYGVESHAFKHFKGLLEHVSKVVEIGCEVELEEKEYSLGRSKRERGYRRWCLDNRLFLNPMNDISKHSVAATDWLHLPSMTFYTGGMPVSYAIFNQMLQDYCSSRYILYEGIETDLYKKHFSDKDVCLYGVYDLRNYGVGIEKIKMSFLMAFSIFDKIAYLLNEHFDFGLNEGEVSFKRVLREWRYKEEKDRSKGKKGRKDYLEAISSKILESKNRPLEALYWLSKDFFFNEAGSQVEPDGKVIKEIRNHITHKYLVVFDDYASFEEKDSNGISYNVSYTSLVESSLKVLKISRSALIYCVAAFYIEEQRRNKNRDDDGLTMEMALEPI